MKIEIKADGFDPNKELSHFAMCCAGFELGAQRDHIVSVRINLAGASELRGGKDQFCFVQVELSDDHEILTKAMDLDFNVAIYRALERAGWIVAHRQQRKHRHAVSMAVTERQAASLGGPDWAA